MKYIVKQPEPQPFSEWKALTNDDWQPIYSDLCGETKKAVKDALMAEQGYLCCYCERRLANNDSHIEHFRPQSDPVVDPLDCFNMLCSCQDQLKKGEPRHCGNLKAGWFDAALLISPFDAECEIRFSYNGDGSIRSADVNDLPATETILIIGLNIPQAQGFAKKSYRTIP